MQRLQPSTRAPAWREGSAAGFSRREASLRFSSSLDTSSAKKQTRLAVSARSSRQRGMGWSSGTCRGAALAATCKAVARLR